MTFQPVTDDTYTTRYPVRVEPSPQYIKDKIEKTNNLWKKTIIAAASSAVIAFVAAPIYALPTSIITIVLIAKTIFSHREASKDKTRREKAFNELQHSLTQPDGLNLRLLTGSDRIDGETLTLRNEDILNFICQDFENLSLVAILEKYNFVPNSSLPGVSLVELLSEQIITLNPKSIFTRINPKSIFNRKLFIYLNDEVRNGDDWMNALIHLNKPLMNDLFVKNADGKYVQIDDPGNKWMFAKNAFQRIMKAKNEGLLKDEFEVYLESGQLHVRNMTVELGKGILGCIPSSVKFQHTHDYVVQQITDCLLNIPSHPNLEDHLSNCRTYLEASTNLSLDEIEGILKKVKAAIVTRIAGEFERGELTFQKTDQYIHPKNIIDMFPDLLNLAEQDPKNHPKLKEILINEFLIAVKYPKLDKKNLEVIQSLLGVKLVEELQQASQ